MAKQHNGRTVRGLVQGEHRERRGAGERDAELGRGPKESWPAITEPRSRGRRDAVLFWPAACLTRSTARATAVPTLKSARRSRAAP